MSLFPFINNLSFINLASRLIYLFIFCYSNQNLRLTGKYVKYFLFALFIILKLARSSVPDSQKASVCPLSTITILKFVQQ